MTMKHDMQLSYKSTIRGITSGEREDPVVYFGKIVRVPCDVWMQAITGKIGSTEWERADPTIDIARHIKDRRDEAPVPAGIIERYEVRDVDNGDLLVMVRIPYCVRRAP